MIKPHTPMIRFRKGQPPTEEYILEHSKQLIDRTDGNETTEHDAESIVSSHSKDKQQWKAVPILYEWWDTPVKFKRRELDAMECDIINVSCCFIYHYHIPSSLI